MHCLFSKPDLFQRAMIECIMLVKSSVLDSKSFSVLDEVTSIIEENYLAKLNSSISTCVVDLTYWFFFCLSRD